MTQAFPSSLKTQVTGRVYESWRTSSHRKRIPFVSFFHTIQLLLISASLPLCLLSGNIFFFSFFFSFLATLDIFSPNKEKRDICVSFSKRLVFCETRKAFFFNQLLLYFVLYKQLFFSPLLITGGGGRVPYQTS